MSTEPTHTEEAAELVSREMLPRLLREHARYENALLWLRHMAGVHYLGGAFDPEHMRDMHNFAADALGGKDVVDFGESMDRARATAAEWAAQFHELVDEPEAVS